MQQVFVIHGGTAFDTYDEYLTYLSNKELSLEMLTQKGWKENLQEFLGDRYVVYLPKMPNSANAVYKEWCIWFEKYLTLLDNGVILVGHSLGAVFLAKYLSEHTISKHIKATFLVAPPFGHDLGEQLPQFSITGSLQGLALQGGKIILFHSKDDPVVNISEVGFYQEKIPNLDVRIFDNRGHFNEGTFPEIVEEIKNLT